MFFFQLRASDISALTGRNIHRPSKQAFQNLIHSIHPSMDPRVEYIKTITSKIEQEVRRGPVYQYAVSLPELDEGVCRRAERESLDVFNRFIRDIPIVDRRQVKRGIRTVYLKDRGVILEIYTLRRLPAVGVQWHPTEKSQRFFSATFTAGEIDGVPVTYKVNGCIDGVEFDEHKNKIGLIEVKIRRDKAYLPMHDLDQVMMYIVLSNFPQGRLVQDVNGVLYTDVIMTRDQALQRWKEVRPLLDATLMDAAHQLMALRRVDRLLTNAPVPPVSDPTQQSWRCSAPQPPCNHRGESMSLPRTAHPWRSFRHAESRLSEAGHGREQSSSW
jgi:hypothetical protein